MQKIIHHIEISSSPNTVFKALTTVKGLNNWWSQTIKGGCGEGEEFWFDYIDAFMPKFHVDTVDRNKKIRWTCTEGHDPWKGDSFIFRLKSDDETKTNLLFTQNYTNPVSDEQYGYYNFNWGYYIQSLKDYCESGTGRPHMVVKDN